MDKTASNEQLQKKEKHFAKKTEEIKVSRQIALALKREWEELARKQKESGHKISSGHRVSTVSLVRNRHGKITVKVGMENGKKVYDNARKNAVDSFRKTAEKVYARSKVNELLKKIKEYGYAAVESEIPADLKEAVLKGMEKANISTSFKGEKAEAEAARENSQRAAEFANNAINAVAPSNTLTSSASSALALKALWDSPAFDNLETYNKYHIEQKEPPRQRRKGSSSSENTISLPLPDKTRLEIRNVGDNIHSNTVKALAVAEVLWKQQHKQDLDSEEKRLLEQLNKLGISSLEEFQKKSYRLNNLKDSLIPRKYQEDLKKSKLLDLKRLEQYKEITGKTPPSLKKGKGKEPLPLDLSVGRNIKDVIDAARDQKHRISKEDLEKKSLLVLYCQLNGKKEITPEAIKFSQDMIKNKISGAELWQKFKGEQRSAEEIKTYVSDRIGGKIMPPAPKQRVSETDKQKQKMSSKAEKEALLAPDNAVSAEKIRQAKTVLDKESKGETLSEKEQKLLNFVHQTFSKIPNLKKEDLDDPKNGKQLAAMLQCKKLYSNLPKENVGSSEKTKQTGQKQLQQTKTMTEKERVISKIKENMAAVKNSEKNVQQKKNGLQAKIQQQTSSQPQRNNNTTQINPAIQIALIKKKQRD